MVKYCSGMLGESKLPMKGEVLVMLKMFVCFFPERTRKSEELKLLTRALSGLWLGIRLDTFCVQVRTITPSSFGHAIAQEIK